MGESAVVGSLSSVFNGDTVVFPLLQPLLQSPELSFESAMLFYSSVGNPKFSFTLDTTIQLPPPFTQQSPTTLNLSSTVTSSSIVLLGGLSSALTLPGSSSPVTMQGATSMSLTGRWVEECG